MSKVYLIPVSVFFLFQVSFIGCYIAAVLQGHVVPTVPYISDAATYSPESCVFGQLINIGAALLGITIYVRYRQVLELYGHHPEIGTQSLKYNKLAVWFGLASCLGISVVGNFQETNVRIVHFIGAFCCFGFGTLYFWIQACLSYMLQPFAGTKQRAHMRIGMAVCCTILFIILAVTGILSHIQFKGTNPRKCFIGCYAAALLQGHADPSPPYISDSTLHVPERCVFSQLMNIGALLLAVTVYIRYRQVLIVCTRDPTFEKEKQVLMKHNARGYCLGMTLSFIISITGNFQKTEKLRHVHNTAAILAIIFSNLYFWTEAYLSCKLQPIFGTKIKAQLRTFLAMCGTTFFALHIICTTLSSRKIIECFIGYAAAVLQEHVLPTVPYISDTGAKLPESAVFGQMLNIGAVLCEALLFVIIIFYIRYRHISELSKKYPEVGKELYMYNRLGLCFAVILSIGVSVVANFQVCNVRSIHILGAFLAFGFGTLYFWMQVCISYKLEPLSGTKRGAHIRLCLVAFCTVLFFTQSIAGVVSHIQFRGKNPLKWYPSDGGWHFHVVSSVSEWIVATIFSFFILSYTDEFRDVEIEHPQVNIVAYRISL